MRRRILLLIAFSVASVIGCAERDRRPPRPTGQPASSAQPAAQPTAGVADTAAAAAPSAQVEPGTPPTSAGPSKNAPARDRILWLIESPAEALPDRLAAQPDLATLVAERGETTLHYAARFGKPELAQALLERGADPHAANDSGETPLHYAVTAMGEQNEPLVQLLLDAGADPHHENRFGQTPLLRAIQQDRLSIVELLLRRAAGLSAEQAAKAFCAAAENDRTEAIDALLESAVALNQPLKQGRAPLHIVVLLGKLDLAEHLIERGADVLAAVQDREGQSALHLAAARPDGASMVTMLLRRGADPNAKDQQGRSVLHAAAALGSAQTVQALLDAGAACNARAPGGLTPLMEAARMGNADAARALLAAGADRFAKSDTGWEAGHFARVGHNAGLLQLLGVEPLPQPPADPNADVVIPLLDTVDRMEGLQWTAYRGVPQPQIFHPIACRLTVQWPNGQLSVPVRGTLNAAQTDRVITGLRVWPLERPAAWPDVVAAVRERFEEGGLEPDEQTQEALKAWEAFDPSMGDPPTTELSMRLSLEVDLTVNLRARSGGQWDYQLTWETRPWAQAARIREIAAAWCREPAFSLEHHSGEIYCVAFSPDGEQLATSTYRYVHLWDLTTKESIARLGNADQSEGNVLGVRFAPDGRWLGAIYGDRIARVWHVGTRSAFEEIARPGVQFLAFSSDLKKLLAVTEQEGLAVWDVKRAARTVSLSWDKPAPRVARFTAGGTRILLASREGDQLELWDAATGQRQQVYRSDVGFRGTLFDAVAAPAGGTIFAVSSIALVGFDASTAEPVLEIRCPGGRCLAVSPDGKYVAVGSWLGSHVESVRIYDIDRRQQIAELGKFQPPVHAVCFSPDGKRLAAALRSKDVLIWDIGHLADRP